MSGHYVCPNNHFFSIEMNGRLVDRSPSEQMLAYMEVALCWRTKPSIREIGGDNASSSLSGRERPRRQMAYIPCNFAQCARSTHQVRLIYNDAQRNVYNHDLLLGEHSFETFCCVCSRFRPDGIFFVDRNHFGELRPLDVDYRYECARNAHRCSAGGAIGKAYAIP